MTLRQASSQTVPSAQHLGQEHVGFDHILNLVQRKAELAPLTALTRSVENVTPGESSRPVRKLLC